MGRKPGKEYFRTGSIVFLEKSNIINWFSPRWPRNTGFISPNIATEHRLDELHFFVNIIHTLVLTDTEQEDKWVKWVKSLSRVRLFATPWTVAHQAPPSMGFSRQEHWSGLPFPSSGDLPNPGIKPWSATLQANSLQSELPGKPQFHMWKMLVSEWVKSLSCVGLFATPWTVAYKAPLSMKFSRQEYWSGLPFPSAILPNTK